MSRRVEGPCSEQQEGGGKAQIRAVWDGGNQLRAGEYVLAMSRLGMVGEVYGRVSGKS